MSYISKGTKGQRWEMFKLIGEHFKVTVLVLCFLFSIIVCIDMLLSPQQQRVQLLHKH